MAKKVIVSLPGERDYPVRIGSGIISALGTNLRQEERLATTRDVLVITDSNVAPLYADRVKASLTQAGFKPANITVPAGETSKSIEVATEIWTALCQMNLGRDCLVVTLGGGVVGDLGGFIASTYMRGVSLVHVPTTLLSMVDSSVGGKTAVNLAEGKNLVGTFYQPLFVCADTDTLATLPQREWLCGCGEIAKSAAICSDDFFFWLLDNAEKLAQRDDETTIEAITRSVVFKADVVARDKTETAGIRECLNYGHTLGHAIEACTGYGTFSHGECVAEGMRFAARLACELAPAADQASDVHEFVQAQDQLLDLLGLERLNYQATPEDLLSFMKHDKKALRGSIRFVLATDVARWQIVTVEDNVVLELLRRR